MKGENDGFLVLRISTFNDEATDMSRLASFVRANAVIWRLHLGLCIQRTDLVLTSLKRVALMLPRASVHKTESLAQTRPSALQKVSRWRQRLMLSE